MPLPWGRAFSTAGLSILALRDDMLRAMSGDFLVGAAIGMAAAVAITLYVHGGWGTSYSFGYQLGGAIVTLGLIGATAGLAIGWLLGTN